jgi:hypothetical protein
VTRRAWEEIIARAKTQRRNALMLMNLGDPKWFPLSRTMAAEIEEGERKRR